MGPKVTQQHISNRIDVAWTVRSNLFFSLALHLYSSSCLVYFFLVQVTERCWEPRVDATRRTYTTHRGSLMLIHQECWSLGVFFYVLRLGERELVSFICGATCDYILDLGRRDRFIGLIDQRTLSQGQKICDVTYLLTVDRRIVVTKEWMGNDDCTGH